MGMVFFLSVEIDILRQVYRYCFAYSGAARSRPLHMAEISICQVGLMIILIEPTAESQLAENFPETVAVVSDIGRIAVPPTKFSGVCRLIVGPPFFLHVIFATATAAGTCAPGGMNLNRNVGSVKAPVPICFETIISEFHKSSRVERVNF